MPIPRPFLPIARYSRPLSALRRGTVGPTRLIPAYNARLAVASTLGLSLATLYALSDIVHADVPPAPDDPIRTLRKRKSIDSFSLDVPKDSEALLRQYEETHRPPASSGVLRYDVSQVASNNPLEDDHSEAIVTSQAGDSQWSFFAVLDGHSGWETSALLREELIPSVTAELTKLGHTHDDFSAEGQDMVSAAIRRAFVKLDDRIVYGHLDHVFKSKSRYAATNLLAPANAGACALLAFYDSRSSVLRVALTGDCRAVLGRKRDDGKYDLEVLTRDQNGFNPDEKNRLKEAHPEEKVVKNGRTMGFGPSRVFGDARYKWSRAVQERLRDYMGRLIPESLKTPPYFTAEPVVTATHVQPGDFVVLATDGLWESLTNREVVGLVGQWIHQQGGRKASWMDSLTQWTTGRSATDILPVVSEGKDTDDTIRYQYWRTEKNFTTVDQNAATHLVRNSLGGANEDLRQALLSMRSPRARNFWDDVTATVVFFGERE